MGEVLNFDELPEADSAAGRLLGGRLASYVGEAPFVASRHWSRSVLPLGERVLEVGPGLGDATGALTALGHPVVWVDASKHFARPLCGIAPGVVGDVRSLGLRSGVFAAVLADRVFHHVAGLEDALVELRRVCRTGAVLALTLPSYGSYRTNAPVGAWQAYHEVISTPGWSTARPDASEVVASGDTPGWEIVDHAVFSIGDRHLAAAYSRFVERAGLARRSGALSDTYHGELMHWWAGSGASLELDLVGFSLTAV